MRSYILLTICIVVSLTTYSKVKVACIGNSITYGIGVEDRAVNSYPSLLAAMLGEGYEIANFGKSGATLLKNGHRPYILQSEYNESLKFGADIVVIHLGVNDTDPRNWPNYRDEFVSDYLSLIESYRDINPDIRVIISLLTPILSTHHRFNSGTKLWHTQIQEEIKIVAKKTGAELIDLNTPLVAYPQYIEDGIHPNKDGAKIIATTVYKAITGNYGGLQLSSLYSDNMVLQRDAILELRGIANANQIVEVNINGNKAVTKSNNRGEWTAKLDAMDAGGPYELIVKSSKECKIFKNVMIGEVWLCSGQSNMSLQLKQCAKNEMSPAIDSSKVRLFNMTSDIYMGNIAWSDSVVDRVNSLGYYNKSSWSYAGKNEQLNFSAVALHFGKMLQDSLGVTIGLICNSVGGSPIESWIDKHTLESKFPLIITDWLKNDFVQDWVRERAAVNLKNSKYLYKRHPFESSYLYDAAISKMDKFPIKGVVWYQGESNAHNIEVHEELFKLFVESWRNNWQDDQLPFYYVQLPSLMRPTWAWFRDSQRKLMNKIPNIAMIVSSDKGDSLNVHPTDKRYIGERLARSALHNSYGRDITPSGPLLRNIKREEDKIVVSFNYGDSLRTRDGKELTLLEVAGYDKQFRRVYPHQIIDNKIIIKTKDIKQIKYVRYGWRPYDLDSNLINSDSLPASTFISDNF